MGTGGSFDTIKVILPKDGRKWKSKVKSGKENQKLNIKTKMKTNQKQKIENENIKTKAPIQI